MSVSVPFYLSFQTSTAERYSALFPKNLLANKKLLTLLVLVCFRPLRNCLAGSHNTPVIQIVEAMKMSLALAVRKYCLKTKPD